MRRHGLELAVAQRNALATIGQRDDAVVGGDAVADRQVVGGQVRQEAGPQARADDLGLGVQQPLVQRGDDVRVLVRGEDVGQVLHRHVLGQLQRQRGVGQVAARIEQHVLLVVDDQELVGLNTLTDDQIVETQALVAAVIKQDDGLATHGYLNF
ncbi:hypothetical protein D3C77_594030 [compost metagenome]